MTSRAALAFAALAAVFAVFACGGPKVATTGPRGVDIPVTDGVTDRLGRSQPRASGRETPPASAAGPDRPFPATVRAKLANGLGVDVVKLHALPIVELRLVVRAGAGYGSAPGVASIAVDMLKNGGTTRSTRAELLQRIESLGADLSVACDTDASTLGLALTKDKLDVGMALLAEVAREPRFDANELRKLEKRTIDATEISARADGGWAARWLLFHELFPAGSPYAVHAALPSQIAAVDVAKLRDFHRRFFVPRAATLIVAGDVEDAAAKELAQKHFGSWTGGEAPKVDFPPPKAIDKTRVVVAHRPRSVQSDVSLVVLAPERRDAGWPRLRVATQVLGGGGSGRLFADVREQRSLAYSTYAQIFEVAHGAEPVLLYAGTQSSKTAAAATGLFDNLARMSGAPPTALETERARRYLADVFAVRTETAGAVAGLIEIQETFGLPEGYWDDYKKALRATEAKDAAEVFGKSVAANGQSLLVVAGDADVIAADLTRFGEVTVVDPEKEMKPIRTLPAKP